MNHTRQTLRKHFGPVALVGWVLIFGLAWCADQRGSRIPDQQQEQLGR